MIRGPGAEPTSEPSSEVRSGLCSRRDCAGARRDLASARPSHAALACLLTALGCVARPEPLPPGVVAVMESEQTASFVRNFNPLLEGGSDRWPTLRAMYEPLAIHNPATGEWVPWLAEQHELAGDGTRLRFRLRRGVLWSDGKPFSVRDVVFTFALMRQHKPLDARALWERLRSVEAVDDDTIEVQLLRPQAPAFEEIAQQAIVPEHVWRHVADPVHFANERPVATGPFTEVRFFGPQGYEIGRNPHYWQGRPAIEALRFRAYPGNESALLALLNDEVDWAGMFVPAIDRVYGARDPSHHYWFPLLDATVFLYANARKPPWNDERARKALSMGIDRARIVKVAMNGHTRPADSTGLSDAYARYRDPAMAAAPWVTFDPAAAGRLFDEAGLPRGADGLRHFSDGRPLAVTLEVPTGFSDWIAAAQIMARGWRQLGLQVSVRASEYPAWFERLETGSFELSMCWSDLNTTPYGFYRSLMGTATVKPLGEASSENWHRVGLPETDALFAALESTVDRADERRHMVALERLFAAHAPAIPLFPGPLWGEFNSRRIGGFPSQHDPYAPLSPNIDGPQPLLVLTRLHPARPGEAAP
jgi:peptide/nickel transport system substrate-binding protein